MPRAETLEYLDGVRLKALYTIYVIHPVLISVVG